MLILLPQGWVHEFTRVRFRRWSARSGGPRANPEAADDQEAFKRWKLDIIVVSESAGSRGWTSGRARSPCSPGLDAIHAKGFSPSRRQWVQEYGRKLGLSIALWGQFLSPGSRHFRQREQTVISSPWATDCAPKVAG